MLLAFHFRFLSGQFVVRPIIDILVLKTRHVTRVAEAKEDDLEAMYERRQRRKKLLDKDKEENELEVDLVDALPVKTLDGKLHYKTSKIRHNTSCLGSLRIFPAI